MRPKRSPNFCREEVTLLMELVKKYRVYLDCKKTDRESWEIKSKTWQSVEEEFNQRSSIVYRHRDILRCKYDNLRKARQRKFAAEKQTTNNSTYLSSSSLSPQPPTPLPPLSSTSNHHLPTRPPISIHVQPTKIIKLEDDEEPFIPVPPSLTQTTVDPIQCDLVAQSRIELVDEEKKMLQEKHAIEVEILNRKLTIMNEQHEIFKTERARNIEILELEIEIKKKILKEDKH